MAGNSPREKVRLKSSAGTGTFYVTKVNKRNMAAKGHGKLKLKKYDPKIRKVVEFTQSSIK